MRYSLRTRDGVLKANMSASMADRVMDHAQGCFKDILINERIVTVFKLNQGVGLSVRNEDGDTEIILWEGDMLVPEQK